MDQQSSAASTQPVTQTQSTPINPSVNPQINPQQTPQVQTIIKYIPAPEKSASVWGVIGLLITFPPGAWVMMWKSKRFHTWFHKILFIYGVLGLFGVVDLYVTIPEITQSYRSLGLSAPTNLGFINELNLIFSVLQIVYGVYMWNKLRSRDINIFDVVISGAIIFVPFVIILYLMMITFLTPIYNLSPQNLQYLQ